MHAGDSGRDSAGVCPPGAAAAQPGLGLRLPQRCSNDHGSRACTHLPGNACACGWVSPPSSRSMCVAIPAACRADPNTKAWLGAALEPLFGFPELTRFSWQTVSRLLEDRGPKVIWYDECNSHPDAVAPRSIAFCIPNRNLPHLVTHRVTLDAAGHATLMTMHRASLASSKAARQQSQRPAEQGAPPSSERASLPR